MHVSNLFHHPYQGPLARKLAEWSGMDRVFFCNSGTEAIEGALKLARAAHTAGRSGKDAHPGAGAFLPRADVWRAVGDASGEISRAVRAAGTGRGVRAHERRGRPGSEVRRFGLRDRGGGYSRRRRNFPDERAILDARAGTGSHYGAALIADEIQCGLGRTGRAFAYQRHGLAGHRGRRQAARRRASAGRDPGAGEFRRSVFTRLARIDLRRRTADLRGGAGISGDSGGRGFA